MEAVLTMVSFLLFSCSPKCSLSHLAAGLMVEQSQVEGVTYGKQHEEHHHRRNRPCTCRSYLHVSSIHLVIAVLKTIAVAAGGGQLGCYWELRCGAVVVLRPPKTKSVRRHEGAGKSGLPIVDNEGSNFFCKAGSSISNCSKQSSQASSSSQPDASPPSTGTG